MSLSTIQGMKKNINFNSKKGRLITNPDSTKILLQDGSQHFQGKDKKLSVLYFEEYLLDVNQNDQTNLLNRWKSPSERSLYELKHPNLESKDDLKTFKHLKQSLL